MREESAPVTDGAAEGRGREALFHRRLVNHFFAHRLGISSSHVWSMATSRLACGAFKWRLPSPRSLLVIWREVRTKSQQCGPEAAELSTTRTEPP